jgi:hypothetical protein
MTFKLDMEMLSKRCCSTLAFMTSIDFAVVSGDKIVWNTWTTHYSSPASSRASMNTMIKSYDAEFKVFQSTTAAWPKYGNFGVDWPMGGQLMPMATDVIPFFNDIAYGILKDNFLEIDLMDGYWITYSRPDNREVGTVGSKLSHPGLEVLSAMARIWSMLILQRACGGTD